MGLPTVIEVRAVMAEVKTHYPQIAIIMLRDDCSYDVAAHKLLEKCPVEFPTRKFLDWGGSSGEVDILKLMHRWNFSRDEVMLTRDVLQIMRHEEAEQRRAAQSAPPPAQAPPPTQPTHHSGGNPFILHPMH